MSLNEQIERRAADSGHSLGIVSVTDIKTLQNMEGQTNFNKMLNSISFLITSGTKAMQEENNCIS